MPVSRQDHEPLNTPTIEELERFAKRSCKIGAVALVCMAAGFSNETSKFINSVEFAAKSIIHKTSLEYDQGQQHTS